MTGLSSTVISNLAYVVGALVLAIILGIAVWWRHRQPKSVDANVASFKRGLRALSPENRPAGVRVVTSGAGRGPNGSGETEPMRFTSIKLERIPEPISEPVSVESPGDEAAAVAGEIDEAAEPDAGGHDIAELASDELAGVEQRAGEHETGQDEAGQNETGQDEAGQDGIVAPEGHDVDAVAPEAPGPDASGQSGEGAAVEQSGEAAVVEQRGEGQAVERSGEGQAGDRQTAAPLVAEEGVGRHTVQKDGVLMGDDNSPAAAEASGHPAGGESG